MIQNFRNLGRTPMAAGIFFLSLLVFLPALWNDFVSLDDSLYVYENTLVQGGLSLSGIARAFAGPECNFYHPLTMISLMGDYQLWGLNPAGYHFVNILLHASSAALLFLTLAAMTGARWRSAFVAAIFAIHPLRVESVAWIAERKDVLSVFFFMLTLAAYAWYARRPGIGRYATVLAPFVVGLLCKTSLVALPGVLLLMDYWPLGRFSPVSGNRRTTAARLILEKIPLIVLAIAASVAAVYAQKAGVIPYEDYPLGSRIQNALSSYLAYVGQTFVPLNLSPFYPFLESSLSPWRAVFCSLALAAITGLAFVAHRRAPYLIVGWLWYLGVLVPMIGLVQVGAFARADRFTYLSQIGLLIILTWGIGDLARMWQVRTTILSVAAVASLLACSVLTIRQIGFWSDSESLFRHALAVTRENGVAEESLGAALLEKRKAGVVIPEAPSANRKTEAISHFREAVRLLPGHADAHLNLGIALFGTPQSDDAIEQLQIGLQTMTFHAKGHFLLGLLLMEKGEAAGAISHLEESLRRDSKNVAARINLASAYRHQGCVADALAQYRLALQQAPGNADIHNNLAIALYQAGHKSEAIAEFQAALRCDPGNSQARQNLNAVLGSIP